MNDENIATLKFLPPKTDTENQSDNSQPPFDASETEENDIVGLHLFQVGFGRYLSALLTLTGGLFLTMTISLRLSDMTSWSASRTAKLCFYYPQGVSFPDKSAVGQSLLAASFFGNDAFYFDLGDENTGRTDFIYTSPSAQPDKRLNEITEPESRYSYDTLYLYDDSMLPSGNIALRPYDLSRSPAYGEVLLSNTTGYKLDGNEYASLPYPSDETAVPVSIGNGTTDSPIVLIIHTHGTESYAPEGVTSADASMTYRSSDITENVVAVGKVMADRLNAAGISTIHCEIMHDINSYRDSYTLSADTVQKYLQQYPTIRYIFDIHRDAIQTADGDFIKPVCLINGQPTAQIMLLVGTNEKGADHPDWESNLTVAAHWQKLLTEIYPNFARPVNIRGASFNQQFSTGSLLIEIGSAANTLSEAKSAAACLADSLIRLVTTGGRTF